MEHKSHKKTASGFKMPGSEIMRGMFLTLLIIISLLFCYCSKVVDINVPQDDQGGVSAQGTCVACHSSEEMIIFVADEIPPPAESSDG